MYVRSTRASNEKGGGDLEAAKIAVWAVTFIGVIEGVVVSIVEFSCRHVLGEAYSNNKQVVEYVADMTPLIFISIFMESLQGVLSGLLYTVNSSDHDDHFFIH